MIIGATPDDQTRAAAAEAFGQRFIRHPDAKALIEEKFGESAYPNRILMADLPEDSTMIPNPINQVPGFKVEHHHFVPGFPDMAWPMVEWVLDTYYSHLKNDTPNVEWRWDILGTPESVLLPMMNELLDTFKDVSLSSLPSTVKRGDLIDFGLKGAEADVSKAAKWLEGQEYGNRIQISNTVIKNLSIAFPELTEEGIQGLAEENMQWYGCALIDFFFASQKRLRKVLEVRGTEHIEQAKQDNQNVMILLAHILDWIIAKSRCRHASMVVARDEGMRKLVKSMAPDRLMVFLPDEDLGLNNSVFVPFFSEQKSTLTTTARLAKMGKAVALPTFAYYDKNKEKYITQISKPLENYPC
ncbi:Lipid A biosynthesis myristoyltransferase [Nymphon striatum]|nr:Lipid A biosynthesis myristoyltransferase [Nymphon striatum]